MSIIKEFREFAIKGNAVDLAIGVVVGAAFGKIVTVLVDKIITPPIGLLIGDTDFSDLKLVLKAAAEGGTEVAIGYGELIQAILNFLIVAWALFMVIKAMNFLKRTEEKPVTTPPPPEPDDIVLLREIRDAIKGLNTRQ